QRRWGDIKPSPGGGPHPHLNPRPGGCPKDPGGPQGPGGGKPPTWLRPPGNKTGRRGPGGPRPLPPPQIPPNPGPPPAVGLLGTRERRRTSSVAARHVRRRGDTVLVARQHIG